MIFQQQRHLSPRRAALVFGAVLAASSFVHTGLTRLAHAQGGEPVRIGTIYPKQGPGASIGLSLQRGSELAIEQAGGKVLGRPIELTWLDAPNPQIAQQNMQRLVDENKVVAVVGGNYSSNTLAMMSVANREKIPLISPGSAAREITGSQCSRYTFRVQATAPVQVRGLMPYVAKLGKKVYFIVPSYVWGQDVLRSAREMLDEVGVTEIGLDEVPINTADYSSFILKIRQARPDVVLTGLVGGDLSNFLKQWHEMGMKARVPVVSVAVTDTDFWDIGPAASTGIYVKPWYYNDPRNTVAERKFTADFIAKYGRPPADKSWKGWIAMRSLLESIEAAQSTDAAAIVTALEAWQNTEGAVPYSYRDWDHQLVRPAVIAQVKANIADQWDYFDVLQNTSASQTETLKTFGSREEIGCVMPPL